MLASEEISSDGLRTRTPSAVTRPAAIAACARARLSNRPRATNRRSARSRLVRVAILRLSWPGLPRSSRPSSPWCLTDRNARHRAGHEGRSGELHHFAAQVLAERFERLGDDAFGIEAGLAVHGARRVVIDEEIRQYHRADLQPTVEYAV